MAPTDTTCTPSDDGNDGCDAGSTCATGRSGARCYVAPSCTEGSCPAGSVCNRGALSGKDEVCIPDRCLRDSDCLDTPDERCVRRKTTDVVGRCERASYVALVGNMDATEPTMGCPMEPIELSGKKPPGAACDSQFECKPVCCACDGGLRASALAVFCDPRKNIGWSVGSCASPEEACKRAGLFGDHCWAP